MSAARGIRALLILCISPVVSFAQSEPTSHPTASAWGQVLFAEGDRPIRHARVEFVSSSTSSGESRLTDDQGRFDFEGLEPVAYQVIVSAPGYQKLEATAQVQGKTGPLLLRLRKVEEAASPVSNDVVSVQELKTSGKADKAFSDGTKLLIKGQIAQSVGYFNRAIAKDPGYYRAYHNLGLAQLLLGHTAQAEQALQKAIDLTGGGFAPAEFAMGMALCQEEDYLRAEQVIQKGLEMEPGSATGRFYLAIAQFVLNRPVEAEKSARQAISRRDDLAEAYMLLAGIHQREQNAPAVEQDLMEYLHLQPNGPQSNRARHLLATTQREINKTATSSGAATP
jgi:tetratricopeptide (TPR) repeat protein